MNVEEIITICGVQIACQGNEAVGEIEFDTDQPVRIPSCRECFEYLERTTSVAEDVEEQ